MAFDITNLGMLTTRFADQPAIYTYSAGADSLLTIAASGYFNDLASNILSGDKIIINTNTSTLNFSGTLLVDTSNNVTVAWDNTFYAQGFLDDVSTASTSFIYVPAGVIVEAGGVLNTAITVASAGITFTQDGVAVAGLALTFTTAMAAGTLVTDTPTAGSATANTLATVPLAIVTDGASTTASRGNFYAKVIRGMTA
jgi:hypothetical protein